MSVSHRLHHPEPLWATGGALGGVRGVRGDPDAQKSERTGGVAARARANPSRSRL